MEGQPYIVWIHAWNEMNNNSTSIVNGALYMHMGKWLIRRVRNSDETILKAI